MTAEETASCTCLASPGSCRSPVSRTVLAIVLLVVALSAFVRLWDLDRFPATVFDEHYYVHDAKALLNGGLEGTPDATWKPAGVRSDAHPDLAKLAIAAGMAVLGDGPWGWRVPAALAGIALVALVFPLARRLGLSDEWALAALVLVAADPMLMLESRLAVLDMFVSSRNGPRRVPRTAVRAVEVRHLVAGRVRRRSRGGGRLQVVGAAGRAGGAARPAAAPGPLRARSGAAAQQWPPCSSSCRRPCIC